MSGGAETSDLKEYIPEVHIRKKVTLTNILDDREIEVSMVRENKYCYFCIEDKVIIPYSKKVWKIKT